MSSEAGIDEMLILAIFVNNPDRASISLECMKLLLKKLLVAVDFSKCSEKALRFAAEWASLYGSHVSVLHVMNDALPLGDILNKGQAEELRSTIELQLSKFIAPIFDDATSVEIILEKGKVYNCVPETAQKIGAGIILMGGNGSSEKNNHYLGSNTMRTMRSCHVPVVVISHQTKTLAIESVVFPVDLSKEYLPKLKWLDSFHRLSSSIRVHLLSVLNVDDEFMVNRMSQQLSIAKQELRSKNITHTAEIIRCNDRGDGISRVVTDYAVKVEASLIFILIQPESIYTPFYVSSVLQEIIALSGLPVMAVNPAPVNQKEQTIV